MTDMRSKGVRKTRNRKALENMKPRELLEILHIAERLKDATRHCYQQRNE